MRRRKRQNARTFAGGSPWPIVLVTNTARPALGSAVTSYASIARTVAAYERRVASRAMRSATSCALPVSEPYSTSSAVRGAPERTIAPGGRAMSELPRATRRSRARKVPTTGGARRSDEKQRHSSLPAYSFL